LIIGGGDMHLNAIITDFGVKYEKCEAINTITLENGELRKQV
jgi:hypothetical protein